MALPSVLRCSFVLYACCIYLVSMQVVGRYVDSSTPLDAVTGIQIVYPVDGAIDRAPVEFKTQISIRPGSEKQFLAQSQEFQVCVEVNGETINCARFGDSGALQYHRLGNCTARAYVTRSGDHQNQNRPSDWESDPISFTLMNEAEFQAFVTRTIESNDKKHRPGFLQSLVEWAHLQRTTPDDQLLQRLESDTPADQQVRKDDKPFLIVGVRTAVVSRFAFRQASRETWASKEVLPPGVEVFFLGCRPFARVRDDGNDTPEEEARLRSIWEAIELEKLVYEDLLTDELDCDDSYVRLADKVKEFFHFAATRFQAAQYVMVADDDIYLRLDGIVARLKHKGQQKRYYAGQVRAIEHAITFRPDRNPTSRHHISAEQYPMNELPPFAAGTSFFLSMDRARFVSKNRRRLRDLGGIDDSTVSLWMLATQVHPKYFGGIDFLSAGPCRNDLVSLSDLTESVIRVIHENVRAQRPFCHGFQQNVWLRQNIGAPAEGHPRLLSFLPETIKYTFSLSKSLEYQLSTTISTATRIGVKVVHAPTTEPFEVYARKLCAYSRLHFPSSVETCSQITTQVRNELKLFIQNLGDTDRIGALQLAEWVRDVET